MLGAASRASGSFPLPFRSRQTPLARQKAVQLGLALLPLEVTDIPKTQRLTQIRAGRMVRAVLYTQPMAADEPTQRAAKSRVSSAARTKLNQRAMWQKCEAIMAANFDRHDLWVTLTYRDADLPHSREQAVRCLAWFIDELRRVRREDGEDVRYIKNVEHLTDEGDLGRWHHHLVLNSTGEDVETIRSLWSRFGDNVEIVGLLDGTDYEARARYLCKERQPAGKQGFVPSRGLKRPERTSELVDDALTLSAPPGAVVLEVAQADNSWGRYCYIKYLLPYKPPRRKPKRPTKTKQGRIFSDLGQCISFDRRE